EDSGWGQPTGQNSAGIRRHDRRLACPGKLADGTRSDVWGHGEYGSVMEAGMEHLGEAVHMGVGQRPARQECARPQDGHERQQVAGRMAPARMASRKLRSTVFDSGFARLDTNASGSGPGIVPDGQWDSESAGGCQHPASQRSERHTGKERAGETCGLELAKVIPCRWLISLWEHGAARFPCYDEPWKVGSKNTTGSC